MTMARGRDMSRLATSFAIWAFGAVGLLTCAAGAANGWVMYRNNEHKFSLEHPSHWQPSERARYKDTIAEFSDGDGTACNVARSGPHGEDPTLTVDDATDEEVAAIARGIADRFHDGKVLWVRRDYLSNEPPIFIRFNAVQRAAGLRGFARFVGSVVFKNDYIWVVQCMVLDLDQSKADAEFAAAEATFRTIFVSFLLPPS